jgi:outer membrane cobalamin receptor
MDRILMAGRLDRKTGGSTCRLLGRVAARLVCLLATPAALSGAQQEVPREVTVTVRLVSEGGGPLQGARLVVVRLAVQDSVVRDTPIDAATGVVKLGLQVGTRYRLVARAAAHRDRELGIDPSRPTTLRIVLSVDPYELPPIVATGDGVEAGRPVRSVHQIQFGEESLTYATVAEWLADVPGVSVRSGSGGRQMLSVRGSRPEDVLVLLDGVPLHDPLTGRADLSTIPTSTLESGTLVFGAASQAYGSGAAAGVLLLASRVGKGRGVGGGARMGSFGRMGLDIQADAVAGERRMGVSFAAERFQNDFSFRDPVGPGGATEVRTNADGESVHGSLEAATGPVHASLRFDRAERGIPGRAGTSLFESARADERTWIAAAGLNTSRMRASGSYGWRRVGYRASSSYPVSAQNVQELRLAGDVGLPSMPVTVGARLARETVRGDLIDGAPERTVVGARTAASLFAGSFRFDPALSLDVSGDLVAASPELSATWLASSRTRVWARLGQGFRLPTFGDLYFGSQYQLRPNPDLAPERITFDSEAGAATEASVGRVQLRGSATAWARRTESPIVWLPSSVAVWSPRNLGELWAAGLEFLVELTALGTDRIGWRAQVSGTIQRSRVGFGSNRNPLPYEPQSTARLSVEAWRGALGGRIDLRHTGSRTTSLAATRTLAGFRTVDVSARHQVRAGSLRVGLFLRAENVLDQRYQLIELFPEPGRRFTVRLEARRANS